MMWKNVRIFVHESYMILHMMSFILIEMHVHFMFQNSSKSWAFFPTPCPHAEWTKIRPVRALFRTHETTRRLHTKRSERLLHVGCWDNAVKKQTYCVPSTRKEKNVSNTSHLKTVERQKGRTLTCESKQAYMHTFTLIRIMHTHTVTCMTHMNAHTRLLSTHVYNRLEIHIHLLHVHLYFVLGLLNMCKKFLYF